jgi:ketosteroid isomerase-like protein
LANLSFLAAIVLAVSATPAAAAQPAETVDAFHAALQNGITQAALKLLAPNALIFEAGHIERSAAEYAGGHLAGDAAHAAKTSTQYTARHCILGADQAVIATESISTARDGSDPRIGTETMVLVKHESVWRIAHIHWSSRKLPPAKPAPPGSSEAPSCT